MAWVSLAQPEPDREYVALVSYLLLREPRELPVFLRHVEAIRKQLSASRGLIGYSLRADFPERQFWTLSIWEDGATLEEFVHGAPHVGIMKTLRPHMAKTKFVRWKTLWSSLAPTWEDALARLEDRQM